MGKLRIAKFIREVRYPKWLANIVPMQKKNDHIRVCIDYRYWHANFYKSTIIPHEEGPLRVVKGILLRGTIMSNEQHLMRGEQCIMKR